METYPHLTYLDGIPEVRPLRLSNFFVFVVSLICICVIVTANVYSQCEPAVHEIVLSTCVA